MDDDEVVIKALEALNKVGERICWCWAELDRLSTEVEEKEKMSCVEDEVPRRK